MSNFQTTVGVVSMAGEKAKVQLQNLAVDLVTIERPELAVSCPNCAFESLPAAYKKKPGSASKRGIPGLFDK